jgi:NADH-quinone oxidoreductase subunit J
VSSGDIVYTLSFYLFGLIAILAALVAVASQRILRAAVGLAVTLVCGAAFYILLSYDFIAGVQILVYVGGIVVLIVYAIMLTSSQELVESHPTFMRKALAFVAGLAFVGLSLAAILSTQFSIDSTTRPVENLVAGLGRLLLSAESGGYLIPFEIISLLFLAAAIGAIVIARSHRTSTADGSRTGGKP